MKNVNKLLSIVVLFISPLFLLSSTQDVLAINNQVVENNTKTMVTSVKTKKTIEKTINIKKINIVKQTKSNVVIPENIEHAEYCLLSRQCEVSEKNKKLILKNILLIKQGKKPLY